MSFFDKRLSKLGIYPKELTITNLSDETAYFRSILVDGKEVRKQAVELKTKKHYRFKYESGRECLLEVITENGDVIRLKLIETGAVTIWLLTV